MGRDLSFAIITREEYQESSGEIETDSWNESMFISRSNRELCGEAFYTFSELVDHIKNVLSDPNPSSDELELVFIYSYFLTKLTPNGDYGIYYTYM